MEDINIFACDKKKNNNNKELESQIQTFRIFSQNKGLESEYEKSAKLIIRTKKKENWKNRTVKSGKHLNTWRKRTLQISVNVRRELKQIEVIILMSCR